MAPKKSKKASVSNAQSALSRYSQETNLGHSSTPMLPPEGDRVKSTKKPPKSKVKNSKSSPKTSVSSGGGSPAGGSIMSGGGGGGGGGGVCGGLSCVNKCDEMLRKRRKAKQSVTQLPSIPEGICVRGCRRKGKEPIQDMSPVVKKSVREIEIKQENLEEVAGEEKNEKEGKENEVCATDCGPDLIDAIAGRADGPDPLGELCQPICCPPNIRSETELMEEFVAQLMAEAESTSAAAAAPDCLCEEVTRWMRYFMCGCDLNKDATAQLADAVAEADSRIPGLLKALTDELRAQAEKAREQPKDKKLEPAEQRVRWYVAARALRAVKLLDEASDRWRLAAALKVAADMAAAEYEEILRQQLDVMMTLLQKRLEKDWEHRTAPYLANIQSNDFFRRSSGLSL